MSGLISISLFNMFNQSLATWEKMSILISLFFVKDKGKTRKYYATYSSFSSIEANLSKYEHSRLLPLPQQRLICYETCSRPRVISACSTAAALSNWDLICWVVWRAQAWRSRGFHACTEIPITLCGVILQSVV